MRALRYDEGLHLAHAEPMPTPEPGEALIRLRLAGICHTDLELTRGYMGFRGILGHEFVGELAADAGPYKAGQRVVGEINIACGHCEYCAAGIPSQCIGGRRTLGIVNYPGAFGDWLRLPIANLHPVPDNLPDDAAVFTEPLAAAFQVPALTPIHPDDRVVVVGAGKLGLLIAQVLKLTGCDLIVLVRHERPAKLVDRWGIRWLHTGEAGWQSGVRGAHIVVDSTGSAEGFALALDIVRPRGTVVLKSTYAGLPSADLTRVVVDEVRIVGSRCGPFAAALRAMTAGQIDTASMIEAVYPLEAAEAAFERASGRGMLKVLLQP